jgi:hypothetical protein
MHWTLYRSDSDELQRLTGKRVERWSCITVALRLSPISRHFSVLLFFLSFSFTLVLFFSFPFNVFIA